MARAMPRKPVLKSQGIGSEGWRKGGGEGWRRGGDFATLHGAVEDRTERGRMERGGEGRGGRTRGLRPHGAHGAMWWKNARAAAGRGAGRGARQKNARAAAARSARRKGRVGARSRRAWITGRRDHRHVGRNSTRASRPMGPWLRASKRARATRRTLDRRPGDLSTPTGRLSDRKHSADAGLVFGRAAAYRSSVGSGQVGAARAVERRGAAVDHMARPCPRREDHEVVVPVSVHIRGESASKVV
jgi:hypothetical protein